MTSTRSSDGLHELKTCELCGTLFTRAVHPESFDNDLGLWLAAPLERDCPKCRALPPIEDGQDPVVSVRSYRLVGVRMTEYISGKVVLRR